MAPQTPNCEPTVFTAGDSLHWTRTLVNYPPADGWVLHYRIIGPSTPATQPVVTVVNGAFDVVLAATATADDAFIAGEYRITGWVDGVNSERHVVFNSFVEIRPNVALQSFATLQTHEERMLAACEAALEGRLTNDVARYGREGAFVDKLDYNTILRTQGIYKAKLWRLQNPGLSSPRHVVRFGDGSDSGVTDDEAIGWPGFQP